MPNYPIDFVVPWVDGSDPNWRAERAKYRPDLGSDSNAARYRDWGLFQYWFRSIELYAPWVRKVHLVTWGHLPPWLNTNHPKLNIVHHQDYIPEKYLPVFSSHPIELCAHRIPDLAEHFVLFNDDVYLSQPTTPEDFFVDGVPVDAAVLGNVTVSDSVSFMPYISLNCLGIINENFSKRESMKRNWKKWFSLKYGKLALYNLYYWPGVNFQGFRNFHTCLAYRKSAVEEIWEKYGDVLDQTCSNRFRSRGDVNHYLYRWWRLAKGDFVPGKPNCAYLTIGEDEEETVRNAFDCKAYKIVCVNDDPTDLNFEEEQKTFSAIFENRFPNRCEYEL